LIEWQHNLGFFNLEGRRLKKIETVKHASVTCNK